MNIYFQFEQAASENGNKIALVHGSESWTYEKLQEKIHALESRLRSKGIEAGDRVLVFVPMGLDLYASVLALFRMGAVVMFIDEWASRERVKNCLRSAPCTAMLCTTLSGIFSWKVGALRNISKKIRVGYSGGFPRTDAVERFSDDEALITFTTGSTGLPKAANRTHGFLQAQLQALEPYLSSDQDAVNLCTLPIITLLNLGMGKSTVIPDFSLKPKRFDAGRMTRTLEANGVTELITSPYYVTELCKIGFPAQLNIVQTGGGAVFAEDAAEWSRARSGAAFTVFYGSTECEPVSHIGIKELADSSAIERGLPVGAIVKETSLRILKISDTGYRSVTEEEFEEEVLEGLPGEIVVSGNHVLASYIGLDETALDNKIRVGSTLWHRTGDAGYCIGNKLFLLGRCSEMLATESGAVFPFEVEGLLRKMFGKTSGTMLEMDGLWLFLLQEIKWKEDEIMAQIWEKFRLTPALIYVNSLPMDPRHHTKIDYRALKEKVHDHRE